MKQTINFTKFHGLGNDFIIIDGINQRIDPVAVKQKTPWLCDRRLGVGADGVIIVSESKESDVKMVIYNRDGTEPEMCGNGIRCLARFCYDHKLVEKDVFSVETGAGVIVPALILVQGKVVGIEVDMGTPSIEDEKTMSVLDQSFQVTPVSIGNPHAVIIVNSLSSIDLESIGAAFQAQEHFFEGVNVECVDVVSKDHIEIRVWERGAGATLACGTGACAAAVVCIQKKLCNQKVKVGLPGGHLMIEWQESDNHVIMTGPAQWVFDGQLMV